LRAPIVVKLSRAMPRHRDRSGLRSELGGNKRAQDGAPIGFSTEEMSSDLSRSKKLSDQYCSHAKI
jgi:hypothetical protein